MGSRGGGVGDWSTEGVPLSVRGALGNSRSLEHVAKEVKRQMEPSGSAPVGGACHGCVPNAPVGGACHGRVPTAPVLAQVPLEALVVCLLWCASLPPKMAP